ncbi:MAG: hydroxymethylbilane synthase [Candidatus Nanopelagicales bacterium]
MTVIRLGTRRSALAVAQAQLVAEALSKFTQRSVELVFITTAGDVSTASLTSIGGTGVFVSALRDSLLNREIDIAVHSLKDLPTADAPEIEIAAMPSREDPRDALIARDGLTLAKLPAGSIVGTGSPRRAVQLKLLRPDVDVVDIRGNVDTRLGLVTSGKLDAVVLAVAGLKRLGREESVTQWFDPQDMLPAPGQGALAIEVRSDAPTDLMTSLRSLDAPATRAAVTAERAVLAALEAGCSAPVGALAVVDEPGFTQGQFDATRFNATPLHLAALVAATDGSSVTRLSITTTVADADSAGRQLAGQLLGDGVVVS